MMNDAAAMPIFDIVLDISRSGYEETELEHLFWTYVANLYDTRQIANEDVVITRAADRVSARVVCPEVGSLFIETQPAHIGIVAKKIEVLTGRKIGYERAGIAPNMARYSGVARSSFYILRWGHFSPLLCGDTFRPIPLYEIPPASDDPTWHDNYDDINAWARTYRWLYGLWTGSSVGEDFAQRQMQDHRSELSKEGRRLCRRIEEMTGVPTFYFLINYRAWSTSKDEARRCPETGEDWQIAGRTAYHPIAFKCDASRLVSELSANTDALPKKYWQKESE